MLGYVRIEGSSNALFPPNGGSFPGLLGEAYFNFRWSARKNPDLLCRGVSVAPKAEPDNYLPSMVNTLRDRSALTPPFTCDGGIRKVGIFVIGHTIGYDQQRTEERWRRYLDALQSTIDSADYMMALVMNDPRPEPNGEWASGRKVGQTYVEHFDRLAGMTEEHVGNWGNGRFFPFGGVPPNQVDRETLMASDGIHATPAFHLRAARLLIEQINGIFEIPDEHILLPVSPNAVE